MHHRSDSSWLIQTGLVLTEGSRESKGQSWIFKRDSSTSLHTPPADERPLPRSGRATPSLSRRNSQQRKNSKRSLAITLAPVITTPLDEHTTPDWADDQTRAEIIAAQEQGDLDDGDDEFNEEDEEEDPYGILDFDGQFDTDDEEDVRREISQYQLGRWMDGIVDVFLRLEDFPETQTPSHLEARAADHAGLATPVPTKDADTASLVSDNAVEPPPERPKGIWDDVAWFGRLIARTVRS